MEPKIRITVVGDGDTGKTCMLIMYKNKQFKEDYIPTIFDAYSATIPVGGENYNLILQDTAGQEDYEKFRQFIYTETDVFIVCYAINNSTSLENVKIKWAPELNSVCPKAKLILVGTKCDLHNERLVSAAEGKRVAEEIKAEEFIENSAKDNKNINETFCLALLAHLSAGKKKKSRCTIQ